MAIKGHHPQVQYLLNYFDVNGVHEVSWVHRINTREDLERAIQDPSTMMIESDVYYLPDTAELVMAHHDWDVEDKNISHDTWLTNQSQLPRNKKLYFGEWIDYIMASGKGAKIDYKNQEAVLPSLEHIKKLGGLQNTPIIFNADTLKGPGGRVPFFDANKFITLINTYFPDSILSLGCTTGHEKGAAYEHSLIDQMLFFARQYKGCIMFPIRACYVKKLKRNFTKINY